MKLGEPKNVYEDRRCLLNAGAKYVYHAYDVSFPVSLLRAELERARG